MGGDRDGSLPVLTRTLRSLSLCTIEFVDITYLKRRVQWSDLEVTKTP